MSGGRPTRRAAPPPPAPRGLRARIAGTSRWWALAIGLLAGRAVVDAPEAVRQSFALGLALGLALLVARAYRRWAREQIRRRQQQRERQQRG